MITVHKLRGQVVWVNPDLIAFVERGRGGPDVVLTFVDGKHLVVTDTPEEICDAIREHRAAILARASRMQPGDDRADRAAAADAQHLHAVPDLES